MGRRPGTGEELIERRIASLSVVDAVELSRSSDTMREYAGDVLEILQTGQAWVATSPWRSQYQFCIIRDLDGDSQPAAILLTSAEPPSPMTGMPSWP